MKHARAHTAMAVVLWGLSVAWNSARAAGQCCGDCSGDGVVTVNEVITAVNRALGGCSDDGICNTKQCNTDAVQVGNVCVDKYEASVWEIASSRTDLITAVRHGTITTTADLSGGRGDPVPTGSRSLCVSDRGAFDMVGNVDEWVADWTDHSGTIPAAGAKGCRNWTALYGSDYRCIGGDGSVNLPGALFRGGGFYFGPGDGVFAAVGFYVNRGMGTYFSC